MITPQLCSAWLLLISLQNDNWTSGCFIMYILLVHDMWWKAISFCIPVLDWGNKCAVQFWVTTCALFMNLCLCLLFKHKEVSGCLQDIGFSFKILWQKNAFSPPSVGYLLVNLFNLSFAENTVGKQSELEPAIGGLLHSVLQMKGMFTLYSSCYIFS